MRNLILVMMAATIILGGASIANAVGIITIHDSPAPMLIRTHVPDQIIGPPKIEVPTIKLETPISPILYEISAADAARLYMMDNADCYVHPNDRTAGESYGDPYGGGAHFASNPCKATSPIAGHPEFVILIKQRGCYGPDCAPPGIIN